MSIGFQFLKTSKGWRFTNEHETDLTNWSFEFRKGRIVCRPMPLDFIYMAFGTVLFLSLASGLLTLAFKPDWILSQRSSRTQNIGIFLSTVQRAPARSKFQTDPATIEDIRRQTSELNERMMKDMSPEERRAYLNRLAEIGNHSTVVKRVSPDRERVIRAVFTAGKILATFGAVVFALLAMACGRRAILFFRDKLVIYVRDNHLCLTRPKLFGGVNRRGHKISELGPLLCVPRRGGNHKHKYVVWTIQIATKAKQSQPIVFKIEHVPFGEFDKPTSKTREFITALQKMTRLKVAK